MFFRATRPLSPTSTRSIPIFCGGSPDSVNHLWSSSAFSRDSISQPQEMAPPSDIPALLLEAVDSEHRAKLCRGSTGEKELRRERIPAKFRGNWGSRDERKLLDTSAMGAETPRKQLPYLWDSQECRSWRGPYFIVGRWWRVIKTYK